MPTYEYKCDKCGHQFEKFQSFHEEPLKHCPNCNSSIRKILHAPSVVFKGSGWYSTDSKSSNSAAITKPTTDTAATKTEPTTTPAAAATQTPTPAPQEKTSCGGCGSGCTC
ncbi:MAG: FmdB family zinc ribbon protein [bacterium]